MRAPCAILAVLLAGSLLSGCESIEEMTKLLDTKKRLPGERKPVFPEGVPGVAMGVPPELMKGYQPPQDQPPLSTEQAAPAPAPAEKEPPKPQRVAKPKPQTPASAQRGAPPRPQGPAYSQTAPWPAREAAPSPRASGPAPAPPASATAPWPAPQTQAAWPGSPASR
ncbi:MAG TPA: hypothetical protein VIH40_09100 [Xanthobacteraceae bacterium]